MMQVMILLNLLKCCWMDWQSCPCCKWAWRFFPTTKGHIPSRFSMKKENKNYVFNLLTFSGDLNNIHLHNRNIWRANFYLYGLQVLGIQMVVWYSYYHLNYSWVFKWWSEYWTKFSLVFKWHSKTGPFSDRKLSTFWIPDYSSIQIPTVFVKLMHDGFFITEKVLRVNILK